MWLWLVFSVVSADICYDDVFLHRIDALLPSSGPFCLATFRDSVAEAPTLNSDQIEIITFPFSVQSKAPILSQWKNEGVRPFLLPAALFGQRCSSYQTVEIGRNISFECLIEAKDEESCRTSFSATSFSSPFVSNEDEILVQLINETRLLPPEWRNSECHNLVSQLDLRILLNNTNVSSAVLYIIYSKPTSSLLQRFSVRFAEKEEYLEKEIKRDDAVYVMQEDRLGPFELPSMGSCDGERRATVSLRREMATGCLLSAKTCEEAQENAHKLLKRVIPTQVFGNSTSEPIAVVTRERNQPFSPGCSLPIGVFFDVFFARFGLVIAFREEPVGLSVGFQYATVPISREVPISFIVRFIDVSAAAKPHFASLPYIDLRLPSDAFYPFMKSSSLISLAHSSLGLYLFMNM